MKRLGSLAALSLLAVLFAIGFGWCWKTGTPKVAFCRHFDSMPASVSDITVDGRSGLAGSNETLTFRISQFDLARLLVKRGFSDVTEVIQKEIIQKGTTHNEGASIAYHERKRAISYGVTPARYHVITKFEGMIYYVLITAVDSDLVYYHYHKT
ncbi:MAG: hypothetical protein ACJAVK_002706 [Akkermansiaceae bacterium]|jgi:hypothetical protein